MLLYIKTANPETNYFPFLYKILLHTRIPYSLVLLRDCVSDKRMCYDVGPTGEISEGDPRPLLTLTTNSLFRRRPQIFVCFKLNYNL